MSLSEINYNKENIALSSNSKSNQEKEFDQDVITRLQQDAAKLERLYKEEVIKCQNSMSEQEILEVEILSKEKLILQQQQSLQKMTDLNKSLSKKLSTEISYYENTLRNYRKMEKEWNENSTELRMNKLKFDHMIKKKNEELLEIKQELEYIKNEADDKDLEINRLNSQMGSLQKKLDDMRESQKFEDQEDSIQQLSRYEHESSDESDLSSLLMQEEEDDDDDDDDENVGDGYDDLDNSRNPVDEDQSSNIFGNSSSLAHELNNKFDENEKVIKKYQFEIKSLKNEKTQLYSYINKLLKNKPQPDQNSILKEKLVKRKILRAISINQATLNTQSPTLSSTTPRSRTTQTGKRVFSNIVNFKNYQNLKKRPISQTGKLNLVYEQNSDDEELHRRLFNEEDVDEDEIRMLGNQNFGHTFFKPSQYLMNPIEIIILKNGGDSNDDSSFVLTSEDPDLDVD